MKMKNLKQADSLPDLVSLVMAEPNHVDLMQPFTYFRDTYGFIFYAHKPQFINAVYGIRATLVYVPSEKGSRTCLLNDLAYEKVIFHGLSRELNLFNDSLPPATLDRLKDLMTSNPLLKEEFVFVPLSEIDYRYSSKLSLQKIVSGNHDLTGLSEDAYSKVVAAVKLLRDKGVPVEDIGLYGGLQCFMVRNSQKQINDVDLLVDGVEHYPVICELSKGNTVNPYKLAANTRQNKKAVQAAVRRGELSQFLLSGYDQTLCDVRILRKRSDLNSYPEASQNNNPWSDSETVTIKGARVTRANESLSLPYCFEVETSEGKVMTISGRYYEFIGAATIGDEIEARGLQINDYNLVLTDADRHYIVTKKRGSDV